MKIDQVMSLSCRGKMHNAPKSTKFQFVKPFPKTQKGDFFPKNIHKLCEKCMHCLTSNTYLTLSVFIIFSKSIYNDIGSIIVRKIQKNPRKSFIVEFEIKYIDEMSRFLLILCLGLNK